MKRTFHCFDCGKPTTRMRDKGQPNVCRDCGIERAAQAAREMAAKSGPAWERFISSPGAVTYGARHVNTNGVS